MKIEITPRNLYGEIEIPLSKSYSHRHLIASFLANSNYKGKYLKADDTLETINILKQLKSSDQEEINLYFNKSASTLRFIIPILLLTNKTYIIHTSLELANRPIKPYEDIFISDVVFEKLGRSNFPIKIKGPITKNIFEITSNISSQFISGLLFALPLLKYDSKIVFKTNLVSKSYIDITIDVLKKYNIEIVKEQNGYFVKGNQQYKPYEYKIEGDFSQAAYWFVAGTLSNNIIINGLNKESLQGDKEIISIINNSSGDIKYLNNKYYIFPKKTKSFKIALNDIPDLGPILFVLAALSAGTSEFSNIERLIIKESDRLNNMINVLHKFGVNTYLENNKLYIEGRETLKGNFKISSYDDHRILMAIFILATKADGKIIVENCATVSKSYPNFLKDYINLGGVINVIE